MELHNKDYNKELHTAVCKEYYLYWKVLSVIKTNFRLEYS